MFKFKKKKEQANQIELTAMHAQEVLKENKNQLKKNAFLFGDPYEKMK